MFMLPGAHYTHGNQLLILHVRTGTHGESLQIWLESRFDDNMSKPVDVVASTASASSYSSVSTPATYLPQHIEILRNHWSELRRRLHAITVVHKLFQEKVVSHEELEDFVGREESRHQAADRLLMLMLTRSWDHFLVFGKVLSQTTGIDDLGNKLVDEAESAGTYYLAYTETLSPPFVA